MALVAVPCIQPTDIIAMAFYVVDAAAKDCAEIAILVEDTCQGRGLGTLMLEHLAAQAISVGIHEFSAYVDYQNERILWFIQQSELEFKTNVVHGICEISILLPTSENLAQAQRVFEHQ